MSSGFCKHPVSYCTNRFCNQEFGGIGSQGVTFYVLGVWTLEEAKANSKTLWLQERWHVVGKN